MLKTTNNLTEKLGNFKNQIGLLDNILKNKEENANMEGRLRATMARNLQKARDEIYTIGNAVHTYAVVLAEKPSSKMTIVQVNNLQAALSSLIEELEGNGLWDPNQDLKPDLSVPEVVPKKRKTASAIETGEENPDSVKEDKPKTPRKPRTKKKQDTAAEQLELLVETETKPEA